MRRRQPDWASIADVGHNGDEDDDELPDAARQPLRHLNPTATRWTDSGGGASQAISHIPHLNGRATH